MVDKRPTPRKTTTKSFPILLITFGLINTGAPRKPALEAEHKNVGLIKQRPTQTQQG